MRKAPFILLCTLLALPTMGGERIDTDVYAKIRQEGTERSQVLRTLHFLTDVYGPRVTGSPNLKAAGEWAIKQMHSWGLENGHLEPWDFGHPGWVNEYFSAHVTSPYKRQLVAEVLAWTPGTNGVVSAKAYNLVLPERPTQEQLTEFFKGEQAKVKGKIVLVGKAVLVAANLTPPRGRRDDEQVRRQYDPANPQAGAFGRPGGRPQQPQLPVGVLTPAQINTQVDAFLLANGALVKVTDAGRAHGIIIAQGLRGYDSLKALPTVILRNEDYGRIARVLADGAPVDLEFNITNRFFPEGRTAYNVVAEIPGTDKKDEVIMLGGHLDSWHGATGATDNAIGCAMMMEAARILKALGVRPRRTIRVALWSGEEEGLLGSQAYVKEHFGSVEEPKPEFYKLNAYLNIDTGTGRPRGASVFGPPEGATVLREALAPFADLGFFGVAASRSRNLGGTDHTSFNKAGLPGIGFGQDPIEYNSHTHHTNLDTYERIIEEDVRNASVVIAAALYHLAMRDEMLPRFSKEAMPEVPAARPTAGGQ